MNRIVLACLVSVLALAGCQATPPRTTGVAYTFVQKDCAASLAQARAICGTVSVPENYSASLSRRIALNVIVFKALEPTDKEAAQFDLEGGPGFAVTDSAGFYATDGAAYRERRDLVLADMRGTGSSNPLGCEAIERHSETDPLAPLYPPNLVATCAAALSASSDLRQYTTAAAAKDIDAIRSALGYRQLDLNALSYGTTLALRYIADYPQRVRTMVLTGVVPANRTPPRFHAAAGDRGLKQVIDACDADAACSARFPDPWADLARGVVQLAPEVRPVFLEKLRTMLYMPASARRVPLILDKAAAGDTDFLEVSAEGGRSFSDGLYLSITCSESLARMDVVRAISEASSSVFGAYRLQRQREACAQWPVAEPDPALFSGARSDVPALFISGAFDPVSPASWTTEVSSGFPNGTHIVVPGGGHVMEGMTGMETCIDVIVLQFLAMRSANQIDLSCVASMDAGPFVVE